MKSGGSRRKKDSGSDCLQQSGVFAGALAFSGTRRIHRGLAHSLHDWDCDVPDGLKARVFADATEAASHRSGKSLTDEVNLFRKFMVAGAIALIVFGAVALGILPGLRGNDALAQVARAMAKVESVHLTGFVIDDATGEHLDYEMWIKHPSKFLLKQECIDNGVLEVADNGRRRVRLLTLQDDVSAEISMSGKPPRESMWFQKEGFLQMTRRGMIESKESTLPDGRPAHVMEFAGLSPVFGRALLTVDDRTNLIFQYELYRKGKLAYKIERIDYNVEMPDSMFELEIPENASVRDLMKYHVEIPEELIEKRADVEERMKARGAVLILASVMKKPLKEQEGKETNRRHTCGTLYHSGMLFEAMGDPQTCIWYDKTSNAYYVLGKAIVTDGKVPGYTKTVENAWFTAPYESDREITKWKPYLKINEPGGVERLKVLCDMRYDGFCSERIQNVGKGPLEVRMWDEKGRLKIIGEAMVYPQGKAYHDGEEVEINSLRSRGPGNLYVIEHANYGSMSALDKKAFIADMKKHNAAFVRFSKNEELAHERVPKYGWRWGPWAPGVRISDDYFTADTEIGMTLYYIPGRDSIYVSGRATLVTHDSKSGEKTVRTVENEEVKAPSPDYARSYMDRRASDAYGMQFSP